MTEVRGSHQAVLPRSINVMCYVIVIVICYWYVTCSKRSTSFAAMLVTRRLRGAGACITYDSFVFQRQTLMLFSVSSCQPVLPFSIALPASLSLYACLMFLRLRRL